MWMTSIAMGLASAVTAAQGVARDIAKKTPAPPVGKKPEEPAECREDFPLCDSPAIARPVVDQFFPNGQIPYLSLDAVPKLCQALLDSYCGRVERLYPKPVYPSKITQLKGSPTNAPALILGAIGGGILFESTGIVAAVQGALEVAAPATDAAIKGYLYYQTASTTVEIAEDGELSLSEAYQVFMTRYVGNSAAQTLAKNPGPVGYAVAGLQIALGGFATERGGRFIETAETKGRLDLSAFEISAEQAALDFIDGLWASLLLSRTMTPRTRAQPALASAPSPAALPAPQASVPGTALANRAGAALPPKPADGLARYGAATGGAGGDLALPDSKPAPIAEAQPITSADSVSDEKKQEETYLSGSLNYSQKTLGPQGKRVDGEVKMHAILTDFGLSFGQGPWGKPWRLEKIDEAGYLLLKPEISDSQAPDSVRFKPDPGQELAFRVGDRVRIHVGSSGAAGRDPLVDDLEKLFAEYAGIGLFGSWKKPGVIAKILGICLKEMGFDQDTVDGFLLRWSKLAQAKRLFDIFHKKAQEKEGVFQLVQELRGLRQRLDGMGRERMRQYDEFKIYPPHRPRNASQNYRMILLRMALNQPRINTTYLLGQELTRRHDKIKVEPRHIAGLQEVGRSIEEVLKEQFELDASGLSAASKRYVSTLLVFLVRDGGEICDSEEDFSAAYRDFLILGLDEIHEKIASYVRAELGDPGRGELAGRPTGWVPLVRGNPTLNKYYRDFTDYFAVLDSDGVYQLAHGFQELYAGMPEIEAEFNPDILLHVDASQRRSLLNRVKSRVHSDSLSREDRADSAKIARRDRAFRGMLEVIQALDRLKKDLPVQAGVRARLPRGRDENP